MKLLVPSGAPDQRELRGGVAGAATWSSLSGWPSVTSSLVTVKDGPAGAGRRGRGSPGGRGSWQLLCTVGGSPSNVVRRAGRRHGPRTSAAMIDAVDLPDLPRRAAARRPQGRRRRRRARRPAPGPGAASPPGADVHVVSPEVTPAIEGMVGRRGDLARARVRATADLDGAWYVIAATDDRRGQRGGQSRRRRRAGSSACAPTTRPGATAWTPAVGRHAGVTVAVLGNREPRRSRPRVRDEIVERAARGHDRRPGTSGTARPAWCSSVAGRATRS